MPAMESRTARSTDRSAATSVRGSLDGVRKVVAGLVAEILRGLAPAPVLQPIPVRVRPQRRS
jgi:hypothetical protein